MNTSRRCPTCNALLSANEKICPFCNSSNPVAPVSNDEPPQKSIQKPVAQHLQLSHKMAIGIAAAVLLTGGVGFALMHGLGNASPGGAGADAPITVLALETQVNSMDGAEMVKIPSGEFLAENDGVSLVNLIYRTSGKAFAPRKVTLPAYWIYKYDVTVGQYRKFCAATGEAMPLSNSEKRARFGTSDPGQRDEILQDDHPIYGISVYQAAAYCRWASQGNVRVTLPTESQWKFAAGGPQKTNFPWGDAWDSTKCATSVSPEAAMQWSRHVNGDDNAEDVVVNRQVANSTPQHLTGTTAVGSYPPNGYGLYDMIGNVSQWCWIDIKPPEQGIVTAANSIGIFYLHGSSWQEVGVAQYEVFRRGKSIDRGAAYSGFRCVNGDGPPAPAPANADDSSGSSVIGDHGDPRSVSYPHVPSLRGSVRGNARSFGDRPGGRFSGSNARSFSDQPVGGGNPSGDEQLGGSFAARPGGFSRHPRASGSFGSGGQPGGGGFGGGR